MGASSATSWARLVGSAIALDAGVCSGAHAQCQYDVTIIQGPSDPVFGPPVTIGLGLNNLGDVVGHYYQLGPESSKAFVFSSGSGMFTLPHPAGTGRSQANDITDGGLIVGTYEVINVGFHGYVYEDGQYTELPPLPGGAWSQALAVNNAGTVAGYRSIGNGVNPFNAFIWSHSEGFTDLGVMKGPPSSATSINSVSQLAGWTGSNELNSTAFV